MPIAYIDVPPGIRVDAKKKLVKEVFVALDEAYRVPDTRIFLREWPLEQVSQDGRLDSAPAHHRHPASRGECTEPRMARFLSGRRLDCGRAEHVT